MINNKINLHTLISKHSFPLYIYDKNQIIKRVKEIKENFEGWNILYSVKANPFNSILKLMKNQNIDIDAASRNEVLNAHKNGFAPSQIYYSSPGKSEEDISRTMGKCMLIADSINEIEMINNIAKKAEHQVQIGVRLNVENNLICNNAFEIMGGVESKFGISMSEFLSNREQIQSYHNIKLIGIHIYFGSQILEEEVLINNFLVISKVALEVNKHIKLSFVNFGGGFGVPYNKADVPVNLKRIHEKLLEVKELQELKKKNILCNLELGRYMVARSGYYATKVMDIKKSGTKKYVVLYGGMNSFFRPVFTKEFHNVYKYYEVESDRIAKKEKITLVGSLCTPIDQYYEEIEMDVLDIGDIVVFENAGAYGYSMSLLDFISYERPTQLLIGEERNEFA